MRNWFLIALLLASTAAAADTLTITGDNLTVKDSTGKVVYPSPVIPPVPVAPTVTISSTGGDTGSADHLIQGTIDAADLAAPVTVLDNGQPSATATAGSSGAWSATITMVGLGNHVITARATNAAGTGTSNAITYNLVAQPPPSGPVPPAPVTTFTAGSNAQALLNAVPVGGSLVFPAGSSTGSLRCKAGVTIWAEGIVNVTGSFDCSGLSGWTVRGKSPGQGFVFNGGRVNATGASQWAVGNVVFNNTANAGFDGSAVGITNASFGRIINVDFNGSQGNVVGMYSSDNIEINGAHFINCRQPISLQFSTSTTTGRNIKVLNSVFIGTSRAAMEMGPSATTRQYMSGLVVDNNFFDSFSYNPNPDNYSALLAISLVAQGAVNTTVTNNFIRMGPANAGHGAAIEVTGTGETKNNVVWGWYFAGFTYQYGWNVHDNTLYQTRVNFYANPSTYTGTFANNNMVTTEPPTPPWPTRIVW